MEKLYWRWLIYGGAGEAKGALSSTSTSRAADPIGRRSAMEFMVVSRARIVKMPIYGCGPARQRSDRNPVDLPSSYQRMDAVHIDEQTA